MSTRYITTDLPGTGGALKAAPEDFIVEEVPAYPPSGEGDHLFLLVEKRGITTHEMVRRVARALGIPQAAIGTAGQKDRQAIARQLISVPAEDPQKAANLRLEDVAVLSAARHRHKLRTGHLKGNRFHVVLRGVVPEAEARARAILDRLSASWLPNFFGRQRFGRGDNPERALAMLRGELRVPDRFQRRFLVSSLQSLLFNDYLAARMDEGTLDRVMIGDVMQRVASGGLFLCGEDELVGCQGRLEAREIVPTGPMFGPRMYAPGPGSPAAQREQRVLDGSGLSPELLAALGRHADGTRRALLARIDEISLSAAEDRLTLDFALPTGSYATVLLDEVMKPGAAAPPSVAPAGNTD